MKRTQDRIKDYVEPQAFDEVPDAAADPARAVAAYRFTDATSDLLARWLDALADLPRGRGAAKALAGVRGVGKSHTLAVFTGLAGRPELRAAVKDAHAATSARRLLERRHTVVRVARGLRPTLAEELADALADTFGGGPGAWGETPEAMLAVAASRVADAALVVVVDTACERSGRVRRDDGPTLSRLAQAAQSAGVFVALALDDDIADASGVNSVIAGSYQIDYLDPEHLYRVADQYLLRKNPQARAALHDIYLSLRAQVPGFNWSEPRFAALYPVHPLVADVASAVRLYAPSFAFLPFAAAASLRAAGRPALSLILLDEVFDRAEAELRKAEELREAFAAYDELATKGVARLPAMQRMQAKLILKSLFVHSLDGRGATPGELCAGLLLGADGGAPPASAIARVAETLTHFAAAVPGALGAAAEAEGGEARLRFQISAPARFDRALSEATARADVDESSLHALLCAAAGAQFADWPLAPCPTSGGEEILDAPLSFVWRGSERHGRVLWRAEDETQGAAQNIGQTAEWQLVVRAPASETEHETMRADGGGAAIQVVWRPATLTAEESEALRRLAVLRADARLATGFGEAAHAAAATLAAQAQRIWARAYVDEGVLVCGDHTLRFDERSRGARRLADALARTLAPLFDARYPQHPTFNAALGEAEVARLTEWFLGHDGGDEGDIATLSNSFAVPLRLAAAREDGFGCVFLNSEDASRAPWLDDLRALLDASTDNAGQGTFVPLADVRSRLAGEPYGLSTEAQRLLLSALVARREIELITATGERYSRHTLASVKWNELTGVCRPAHVVSEPDGESEDLFSWARCLTGGKVPPMGEAQGAGQAVVAVRAALAAWLAAWREENLLARFDELPEEILTTSVWGARAAVRKSFGAATDAVAAALDGDFTLEEGLRRVADAFARSPETFARHARSLAELKAFVEHQPEREGARLYLAFAEETERDEIESARRELRDLVDDPHGARDPAARARFTSLWREFRERYAAHYAAEHERARRLARECREEVAALTGGERWQEFEALSELPAVRRDIWDEAEDVRRLLAAAAPDCELSVGLLLETQPFCACPFRLSHAPLLARLPAALEELMVRGLASYRHTLMLLSKHLRAGLAALADDASVDAETTSRARALSNALAVGLIPPHLSRANVRLIARALDGDAWQQRAPAAAVRVAAPLEPSSLLTRGELEARLRAWLDELPAVSQLLVEVTGAKETHAA